MMLAAKFMDQRYPHFGVALELVDLVGIYRVSEITGNHLNSLSALFFTPLGAAAMQ
ncbi:hypothetical protein QVZ43_14005 [Marinobacter sp. chi1]|uniref:Uncharacterized protein n=1 Tax=Marinobacter suaedae TaxID=3057675 RepID=A0ABT8W3K4_9GAMM|nr:hypothetical protein [Marinobacter sp. chi1]MDO3722833.1 hypothetical protein [Marinobacter sp. chi1]